ncbi:RNA polymerase I specific transcription initiation factor RRN3 protein [Zea mays]|uniref:RNA polymerase I specific transcription initiation factor RRN3 protein n=1 Tax=Zea mays TaxID=4577 RepID=A0A1D6MVS3_MAIZE|nr:RNA polymerase I specific transcription initiation factor RRN3 protein [Zea mays]ONM32898.1 RNA polymerase I specific transcription initiation factor RRN3 protein [Zea mays]ONM32904.1 RNA polymerase I specific transcription initiation factor RRN3 protein [Zea mays]ONM32906.1 RNA polymerase I specific transcription initiation factor RRN3 protein [Zea mays]ONM32907.1 RNA polymerase I specific transcription initiation factor RRN3 protein [Zea mays]
MFSSQKVLHGARLLASPFQLLPLPAWHLFNLSSLSLSLSLSLSFCYSHFTDDNSANWSISHIFKYIYIYGANTGEVVGVVVIMHKLTVAATWIGEGDRSTENGIICQVHVRT